MDRETIIQTLIKDYEQYLNELSTVSLKAIVEAGCLTLEELK